MKKGKVTFVKKLLARSGLLRLLLAHMVACYLTWPIFLLVCYLVSGEIPFGLVYFFLAPYYVPILMLFLAASFMLKFPYFDIMPPLSPPISLWLSYCGFLATSIWCTFTWAARTREKIVEAEVAKQHLSPAELTLSEKRFKRRVRLCLFLILLLALGAVVIVRRPKPPISAPDIKLAYIPPGEFLMGSASSEDDPTGVLGQRPQHEVRISNGFYMGVTEVTQAQWEAIMPHNPSEFKGDDLPVENVTWNRAVEFCKKLSRVTGKRYRLPTEAEWEYACRAGTQTRFYFGDDESLLGEYAWWAENSEGGTHPVGQKKPNAFSLCDMHGNVDEWCSDLFYEEYYATSPSTDPENTTTGIFRVLRGGSWWAHSSDCPCARRSSTYAHMRDNKIGFRVVMEAE